MPINFHLCKRKLISQIPDIQRNSDIQIYRETEIYRYTEKQRYTDIQRNKNIQIYRETEIYRYIERYSCEGLNTYYDILFIFKNKYKTLKKFFYLYFVEITSFLILVLNFCIHTINNSFYKYHFIYT